jgi:translation initiation factor IF-2
MPPRHTYWTIILEGKPTAFRAHTREELLPTLKQLQGKHPDAVLKWFARGKLWHTPEEERMASAFSRRPPSDPRGPKWRPGGEHRDPRERFKIPRDEKRRRFAAKLRGDGGPGRPVEGGGPPPGDRPVRPEGRGPARPREQRPWSPEGRGPAKPREQRPWSPERRGPAKPPEQRPWSDRPPRPGGSRPQGGRPGGGPGRRSPGGDNRGGGGFKPGGRGPGGQGSRGPGGRGPGGPGRRGPGGKGGGGSR